MDSPESPRKPAKSTAGSKSPQVKDEDLRKTKKRELDRRCQRMARERNKAYIAHLESIVTDFKRQDGSGNLTNLMQQLDTVVKERDQLAQTLRAIERMLQGHRLTPQRAESADTTFQQSEAGSKLSIITEQAHAMFSPTSSAAHSNQAGSPHARIHGDYVSLPSVINPFLPSPVGPNSAGSMALKQPARPKESFIPEGSSTATKNEAEPIIPEPESSCDCSPQWHAKNQLPEMNLWRFANETLLQRFKWEKEIVQTGATWEDDVPVRAIVEGWDEVERQGRLSPSWQILRAIDETLFGSCNPTERLAILRMMHLLIMYHSDPSPERLARLPVWFLKRFVAPTLTLTPSPRTDHYRPSQTLAHSYAIDYFAW